MSRLGRTALAVLGALLSFASAAHAAGRWGPERTVFAPRTDNSFFADVVLTPNGDAFATTHRTYVKVAGSSARGEFRPLPRIRDPHGALKSDGHGGLIVLFAENNGDGIWVRDRRPNGTLGPPQVLDSREDILIEGVDVVASPTGDLYAYWASVSSLCGCLARVRVAVRPAGANRFGPVQAVSPPGRYANNQQIVFDRHGNALLAWEQEHDTARGRVAYTVHRSGANGFGPTRTLRAGGSHATAYWLKVASNGAGRVVAAWVARADPLRDVHAAFGTVATGLHKVETVTRGRGTQPQLAIEPGGEAVVAWTGPDMAYAVAPPGAGFGRPRALEHGRPTSPELVYDGAGTYTFLWRTRPRRALRAARRTVGSDATPDAVELAPERVWRATMAATAVHETLIAWNLRDPGDRERLRGARVIAAAPNEGFGHPLDLRTGELGLAFPDNRVDIATDAVGGAFVWWGHERGGKMGFAGRFRLPR